MNALIVLAYSTLYHKLKMLLQKVLNPRKTEKKHKHSLIWKESIIQITSQNNMKTLEGGVSESSSRFVYVLSSYN